jgi:hypothetical protein
MRDRGDRPRASGQTAVDRAVSWEPARGLSTRQFGLDKSLVIVAGMTGIGSLPPPAAGMKTLLERPVFGVERPLSNAWRIRGSRGRDVPIERRRGDAEAVRDLRHADVGISQHRLGGLNASVSFGRRHPVRPARRAAARPACVRSRIRLRSTQEAQERASPARLSWHRVGQEGV